jgi:hypothetical protein
MSEHEQTTIEAIAKSLIEQLTKQGEHFCLHENDFGAMKNSLVNIEKKLDVIEKNQNDFANRITVLETQRGAIIWFISIIGPIIGGVAGILADKFFK